MMAQERAAFRGTNTAVVAQSGYAGPKTGSPVVAQRILRAAAERVALDAEQRGLASPEELAELTRALAASVHWVRTAPGARLDRRLRAPLARELLDALRDDVIHTGARDRANAGEVLGVLADIDRLRRVIEPLESRSPLNAQAGSGSLDLFLAIAQNARSPLNSILFLAETLERELSGPVNETQRKQLGLIYGAALALRSVMSDAVDLARRGADRAEDDPVPFSVTGLLESVRDHLQPITGATPLTLRFALPSSTRVGHPVCLTRVLLNLTAHAVQTSDDRGALLAAEDVGVDRIRFTIGQHGDATGTERAWHSYRPAPRGHRELWLTLCADLIDGMGSELKLDGHRYAFELDLPVWRGEPREV